VPRLGFVLCWLLRSFHPKISLGFLLSPALAHVSTWDGSRRLGLRFLSDTMRERNLEAVSRLFLTQPGRREQALQGTSVGSSARFRWCLVLSVEKAKKTSRTQALCTLQATERQKEPRRRIFPAHVLKIRPSQTACNCPFGLVWSGDGRHFTNSEFHVGELLRQSHAPPSRQCLRTYGWGRKPGRPASRASHCRWEVVSSFPGCGN
jgi:hypothetical protein